MIVLPTVTCPSPPMATTPRWRTVTMVVEWVFMDLRLPFRGFRSMQWSLVAETGPQCQGIGPWSAAACRRFLSTSGKHRPKPMDGKSGGKPPHSKVLRVSPRSRLAGQKGAHVVDGRVEQAGSGGAGGPGYVRRDEAVRRSQHGLLAGGGSIDSTSRPAPAIWPA